MFDFKKLVVKSLREAADRIEVGNSELSETEAMDILKVIAHKSMSKEQAAQYLNMSTSRFDDYVRMGKLPKGKKIVGFKELRWFEDELILCKHK
jgi:predicted DNA-binding transcriptional regulator AlpA